MRQGDGEQARHMMVLRPAVEKDLAALMRFVFEGQAGLTSLPADRGMLRERLAASRKAFSAKVSSPGDQKYLFVLEDSRTGRVVGCCGLRAAVGMTEPFYSYRVGTIVHASKELGVHNAIPTLYLSNDYTGCTELTSLYLEPEFRRSQNGKLLSKSRLLFLAEFPKRFAPVVIAELRGVCDEEGRAPFWEGLGKLFFTLEFPRADYLSGGASKAFIAELMPKYPLYVPLLKPPVRKTIGKPHRNTVPALKMLEREGFRFNNYVDIFDGGPTVEARLRDIRAVRESLRKKARPTPGAGGGAPYLVSNTRLRDFRCCLAHLSPEPGATQELPAELCAALRVSAGDPIRMVPLEPPGKGRR